MKIIEIFYSVFWISAITIIWFYTDVFLHYARLCRIWIDLRLEYLAYIALNPKNYFPDFLLEKSMSSTNAFYQFISKMISCVLCSTVWLSILAGLICGDFFIVGPVYVISLFVIFQIKNLI